MAKMRFLFFFLFFCLTAIVCSAQVMRSFEDYRGHIQKLEKQLEESRLDSSKAYYCFKLSGLYKHVKDTTKASNYLKRGIALSKDNAFLNAASYYYKAYALSFNESQTVERYLLKGDSLLAPFNNKEAYKVRGSIWLYYYILQQYNDNDDEAMENLLNKAIPYGKKSGDSYLLGNLYQNAAISLMNNDQPKKAESYLVEASIFLENSEDTPGRLSSLVKNYVISAENYLALDKYDSTKKQLDKAAPILQTRPTSNITIDYYTVEGLYFDKIKQYAQAIESFDKGIHFPQAHPMYLQRLKYFKYKTLHTLKRYAEALVLIKELVENTDAFDSHKKDYYHGLFSTYAEMGNIQEAYKWSARYISFSDSLYKADYQNYVAEQELKFNNAENQLKIATLRAENEKAVLSSKSNRLLATLLGTISFFLLITVAFGSMYYRNNKKLSEQKEVNYLQKLKEVEQQQQIQFTKALLQGEEKERKRLAGDLHDGLGGMLARVKINLSKLVTHNQEPTMTPDLNKVIDQLDNSVNELRRIARNMMPESLVSLGLEAALTDMCSSLTSDTTKVNFQAFDISHSIAKDTQSTIYRIVQELLTNAIRHAHASQIVVQCSQNESTFFITVEDNGKGFDTKAIYLKNGIGLANVKSRVDYLGGKMDIASAPGDGTTINVELNVIS
jgi:two-component system, NarL family, sensor kinase